MTTPSSPPFNVHCLAGQQLPPDWKAQAQARAKLAEAQYLDGLQNAWKGSQDKASTGNLMRDARLDPVRWTDLFGHQ